MILSWYSFRFSNTQVPQLLKVILYCEKREPWSSGDGRRLLFERGRGFNSRGHLLDGNFFTLICCKDCNVCLKSPKLNKKEAGLAHFER